MRALLITKEGVIETSIGEKVENTYRLLDGLPYTNKVGNLESMQRLMECQNVAGAGYPDRAHACWADDEGLLNLYDGKQITITSWDAEMKLVGKLLVTGFDPDTGETTPATMSADDLLSMVKIGQLRYEDS